MKTKLRRVSVDGYKNLINTYVDFHDFNVLVGPNNSGKSNFLEIFPFVNALLFGSVERKKSIFEQAATPRGLSSTCHIESHKCKPIALSFLADLELDDITKEIEYSVSIQCDDPFIMSQNDKIQIGFVSESLKIKDINKPGKPITLFNREGNVLRIKLKDEKFTSKKIDIFTSAYNAIEVLYPGFERLDSNFSYGMNVVAEILTSRAVFMSANELRASIDKGKKIVDQNRASSFDILSAIADLYKNKESFAEFKQILCRILDMEDAKFLSFQVPEDVRKNYKEAPEVINWFQLKMLNQPLSDIRNFSDGTLMVTAILLVLFSSDIKCPLICIEEPENCLHPKALKLLIEFIKQKTDAHQMLITTHSGYLLNLVSPEDVVVARICPDGGTRFERIQNVKDIYRKLQKGFITFGEMLESEFQDQSTEIF